MSDKDVARDERKEPAEEPRLREVRAKRLRTGVKGGAFPFIQQA